MPPGYIPKLLLIMKLTTFILIISLMQVSAASFGQKMTLKGNNISVDKLFFEIRKQTGYDVLIDNAEINRSRRFNVDFNNAGLDQVLGQVIKETNLTYSIEEKTIVISKKAEPSFLDRIVSAFVDITVRGVVVDENGQKLVGATVKVKGSDMTVRTNENGEFMLTNVDEKAQIQVSFLGYKLKEIKAEKNLGRIQLQISSNDLKEVAVINTGYQTLKPNEVTGSVTVIDNELLNRSASPNLIDRLRSVTNGLFSDRGSGGTTGNLLGITIRGLSTINANTTPLIVIDNFPYDGDIGNINPNDVENITILKDAAAASIWGALAGNGVIVITTKKGNYNQQAKISFNSNFTLTERPDIFYTKQMSSSDYIDIEKFLYEKGYYSFLFNFFQQPLTPVQEVLVKQTEGMISSDEAERQIAPYRNYDLRNDISKYLYDTGKIQQYSLNINGGGNNSKYYVSSAFDRTISTTKGNSLQRVTVDGNSSYTFFNKKLEVSTDFYFTKNNSNNNAIYTLFAPPVAYPYARLKDESGNNLAIAQYRQPFLDTVGKGKLMDWNYRPLDELNANDNEMGSKEYRLGFNLRYTLPAHFTLDAKYQYGSGNSETRNYQSTSTYATRNVINSFAQINKSTGAVTFPIPVGDILKSDNTQLTYNNFRSQINYSNKWSLHNLTAFAGTEIRDIVTMRNSLTFYGYDKGSMTSAIVDLIGRYPNSITGLSQQIKGSPNLVRSQNRFWSYYANAAYFYADKYGISGSIRTDGSNIFGVETNQKSVPLWSIGGSWDLSKEDFYHMDWLPYLKLRSTFGYQGNVNNQISAYLTSQLSSLNAYGAQTSLILNYPNPNVRWEKSAQLNFAVDFSLKNSRLTGTFDYYIKKGTDLIAPISPTPSSGIYRIQKNVANMKGNGFDLALNTRNLTGGLSWNTNFNLSYNINEVTKYFIPANNNFAIVAAGLNPIVGNPLYSVYSYKWAGLDKEGNPQGIINGETSKSYNLIASNKNTDDLEYNGARSPKYFGNITNSFGFKGLNLSFNITYKFDYVFRRPSVNYNGLFGSGYLFGTADFAKRWKNPGDEEFTNIPSLIYPISSPDRDNLYQYSPLLVEKGDHIRLQDIRLTYNITPFRSAVDRLKARIYVNINNVGLLWKANKAGIDPDYVPGYDYSVTPQPRSYVLGIQLNF
jgi:TonB-linked SusC/RagA family outer membrane protein